MSGAYWEYLMSYGMEEEILFDGIELGTMKQQET